jgi:hypothetical protein
LTIALTLVLVAAVAKADSLGADAATAAAGAPLRADVPVSDAAALATVTAEAPRVSAGIDDSQVRQDEETGALLGQLVTQYLDSYD